MPGAAPRGAFRTRDDRWVAISSTSDRTARRLLGAIGGDALATDPRFLTNADRIKNVDTLEKIISAWMVDRTQAEALEIFAENDVVASGLLDIAEIFQNPQILQREDIITVEDGDLGQVRVPGVVPKFSETPGAVAHLSVALGSHNREIYCGRLGLDDTELEALARKGVI
jgi:crotonobetainyl-CoA:carnitine CoA-transferase CaiB-like acyl-CoA transferase